MTAPLPRRKIMGRLFLSLTITSGGVLGYLSANEPDEPREREFTVRARQYAYEPEVIRVNLGDTVKLRLIAEDVVHGFYLEGHDLDAKILPLEPTIELRRPSNPEKVEKVEEIVFTADRQGKFRYRCSNTCGYMHPFMQGELVVAPNRLFPTSLGLIAGVMLGGLGVVLGAKRKD